METASPPTAPAATKTKTAAPSAMSAVSEAALEAAVAATAKALVSAVEASAECVVPAQTRARPSTVNREDKTCFKCGKVLQSRMALRLHINRVNPCDQPQIERKDGKNMWDRYGSKTCPKCRKTFTTTGGLRTHMSRVTPCDVPKPADRKPKIYKCEKCQKVLASAQSLLTHRSRVFPCDDPSGERTGARAGQGGKTCPKCHKTFSTRQSLRIHLLRVTPCDAEPRREQDKAGHSSNQGDGSVYVCLGCHRAFTTEHGLHIHMGRNTACIPTRPLTNASSESGVEHKLGVTQNQEEHEQSKQPSDDATGKRSTGVVASASMPSTQKTHADTERKGISSPCETPTQVSTGAGTSAFATLVAQPSWTQLHYQSFQDFTIAAKRSADRTSKYLSRKRRADRSGEDLSPVEETRKRSCNGVGPFEELVDRLSKGRAAATSSESATDNSARIAIPASDLSGSHGGDILTDGCCCRACVRMWARKTAMRLERLKSEVATLRSAVVPGSMNEKEEKTSAHGAQDDSSAEVPERDSEPSTPAPSSSKTSGCDVEDPVKASLVEKYDRLNDRIITNERALEDSVAYLERIIADDESSSLELRNQIDELRIYINVEKGKRDEAVTAILAHRWNSMRPEFRLVLENMVVKCRPDAEKVFHEDCVEIANQLAEKNRATLQPSTPDREKDAQGKDLVARSKLDVDKSLKQLLESERDALFMRMLRSSGRINVLTKEKFGLHE